MDISWGVKATVCLEILESSTTWSPKGLSWPVMRWLYLSLIQYTRLRDKHPRSRGSNSKIDAQTGCGTHTQLPPERPPRLSRRDKGSRSMTLTTNLHLAQRLGTKWSNTTIPPYAFTVCTGMSLRYCAGMVYCIIAPLKMRLTSLTTVPSICMWLKLIRFAEL